MKKISFLFLFFVWQWVLGATVVVNQDGNGDFYSVQSAVNAVANGDTVLVHPGRYYENIDFNGKNVAVVSLFLQTGNRSFICETILDGNESGAVVNFTNGENRNAMLCGFTIEHGTGNQHFYNFCGGGILIVESKPTIAHCIIQNNYAEYSGGGISVWESNAPYFKDLTIRYNCSDFGGGLLMAGSHIEFDEQARCNIYLNNGGNGADFCKGYGDEIQSVFVDTFTALNYDSYHFYAYTSAFLDANYGKIEAVNDDLFVSADGDNHNSGLSADEPLQTLWFAFAKIISDSTHPHSIHISSGFYSNDQNNQKFPIGARSFISIVGENEETTILSGDDRLPKFCSAENRQDNFAFKNITIRDFEHTDDSFEHMFAPADNKNVRFENVIITENHNNYSWVMTS